MSLPLPSIRGPHLVGVKPVKIVRPYVPTLRQTEDAADQFGLGPWARDLDTAIKSYIGRVYRFFHINPMLDPTAFFGHGQGTIPELVVFGFLLEEGFEYNSVGPRGFRFQSDEAGGRKTAGGAVVDIEVFHAGRRIAVRVNSIYHQANDPFGGGKAVWANEEQRIRLMGSDRFDVVIDVNEHLELEHGPAEAIKHDLSRILVA